MKVKCDCCEKEAYVQPGHISPDDWFYAEINVNGTSDTIIACVCSKNCASNFWKIGPGLLTKEDLNKLHTDIENLKKVKEIMALVEVVES